jgi:hypothetical protein
MTGENTHELLTSSFFSNMGRDKCEEIISCYVLDEIILEEEKEFYFKATY